MHKGAEAKIGNRVYCEQRSWCACGCFAPLRSLVRRRASYIFRFFHHFGRALPQEGRHRCYFGDFLCKRESLLFICRTFGRTALGVRAAAVAAPGILCGGREKGARSLWMLRVRCLPCAIILANALTERVWSAAPGLREKRSWAASLFTLARARRSLPSSDLNGHCLSRGAVSLAIRGRKRACRARHPAAKQGGTAEFSRPWVSEKRPRTVFYCRVRAAGHEAPCRQERKIDESDR